MLGVEAAEKKGFCITSQAEKRRIYIQETHSIREHKKF